jgi:hypothetical protein
MRLRLASMTAGEFSDLAFVDRGIIEHEGVEVF